ncbi:MULTISPECIES: hypothetical protein [Burkholderia]|nr:MULTISPECIES: hypothetical protein [unclassified Burkholderia]
MTKSYNEQQVLERQVREWTAELKRLAGQIAAAKTIMRDRDDHAA